MNENFEKVAKTLTDKKLERTAISLSSKYKPTIAKELERTRRFATELFFKNYENEALTVIEVLEAEEFNGNYNLWTWIQSGLFLKCWILKKNDSELGRQNIEKIIEKINLTSDFGNDEMKKRINTKARNRRLTGSLLHHDKIEKAVAENEKETELAWRIGQFLELLFIYFLGGSEQYSTEKALAEILENEKIIKSLI